MKKINKIIRISFLVIYSLSIIYLLIKWGSMKDVIGVHFDISNHNSNMLEFDVFDNKIYSLYPFIINGIMLLMVLFIERITNKIKTGLKVIDKGEIILKYYIQIFAYIIAIATGLFFYSWTYCVINQQFMNTIIPWISSYIMIIALLSIFPTIITIKFLYNKKEAK